VRALANAVVFEFDPALANLPGSTPARRLIIDRAIGYLDNLEKQAGGASDLQVELATAYEKVAAVLGDPTAPNLGDAKGALANYRKALALREGLDQSRKGGTDNRAGLVDDYGRLGALLVETGDAKGAMGIYQRALSKGAGLETANPIGAAKWLACISNSPS